MKNEAKVKALEADIEQLQRALNNQNLVASHVGSPANLGALKRIEEKQKQIAQLTNEPTPTRPAKMRATKKPAKKTPKRKKK